MANSDLLRGFSNPEMNVKYNHFDRSYHNPFTCKFGQDIPFMCVHLDAGDKVQFSTAALVRSMPLTTAAMLRAKMHFEFYFVPYSQLNHNSNDIFSVTNEFVSSVQQDVFTQTDVQLPYLSLDKFLRYIRDRQENLPKNVFNQNITGDVSRLLDLLDYGYFKHTSTVPISLPVFISGRTDENRIPFDVNPFALQAYQKIWNCYHRNHFYDPINQDAALSFNTDDIKMGSQNDPSILDQRTHEFGDSDSFSYAVNMCALRYHQYKKDLFLSALPSRQDGAVSSVTNSGNFNLFLSNVNQADANARLGFTSSGGGNSYVVARNPDNSLIPGSQVLNTDGSLNFSVLDLRRAQALQQWKETTLRAGRNMSKQMKAHFGFTPKFAMNNYPDFIGSFDTTISVDEVVSTSDTLSQNAHSLVEGAQLGQIAGKGISVTGRNKFRYFTRDKGILMGICYILPSVPYNATGLNPFNYKLKRSDYYMKEFENCGLVPVPRRDLDISLVSTQQQLNSVLGYLPYGYEYKTNYDRVHGELSRNGSLSAWTPNRSDLIDYANAIPATGGLNLAVRYVNPSIMNPLFAINADDTEQTDQFIVNLYNDVKVLSNKSVLGLPNY